MAALAQMCLRHSSSSCCCRLSKRSRGWSPLPLLAPLLLQALLVRESLPSTCCSPAAQHWVLARQAQAAARGEGTLEEEEWA